MGQLIFPPGEKGDALYQAEKIAVSAQYQQTLRDVRQGIESCADCLHKVSGIELNVAKKGSYYAASTYKQQEKQVSLSSFLLPMLRHPGRDGLAHSPSRG